MGCVLEGLGDVDEEPQPRRIAQAEQMLAGRTPDRAAFEAGVELAAQLEERIEPDVATSSVSTPQQIEELIERLK